MEDVKGEWKMGMGKMSNRNVTIHLPSYIKREDGKGKREDGMGRKYPIASHHPFAIFHSTSYIKEGRWKREDVDGENAGS